MFTEPTLGNVTIFAGNFAPRSWAFCRGQLLSISENSALFAILGTTFGGDGQTTFALPDMRSRVAVGTGQGPGLSNYLLGQIAGTENVTFTPNQVPPHSHVFIGVTGAPGASGPPANGNVSDPTNAVAAVLPGDSAYAGADSGNVMGNSTWGAVTPPAGGSTPIAVVSPYLAMNYVIAVEGIFPSRN